MSSRVNLGIASALSTAIIAGILFFLLGKQNPVPESDEGPAAPPPSAPRAVPAKAEPRQPTPVRSAASQPATPETAPAGPAKGGWRIVGRIVRESPPAEGEAAAPAPAVSAEGVVVHMKAHPRRTKPGEGPPPASKTTGPDGRFEFAGVPGTWMRMEIDEPSSAYRTISFNLGDPSGDAQKDLGDIPIEPAHTMTIQLLGPDGEPVKKGHVLVGRKFAGQTHLASLGFNESRREPEERPGGKYVLHRAPPGSFNVAARAPGYALQSGTTELPQKEPLVLRLVKGLTISGTVLAGADSTPIEGAELQVTGPNAGDPPPKARSDGSGRFFFDTLSAGAYTVLAEAVGYASARKENVSSGTEDLEFALVPEAVVSGKVISEEDESPVAGARVTLRGGPDRRESFQKETDEQGRFEVRKLPPGSFTVLAEHEDFAPSSEAPVEVQEAARIADQVLRLKRGLAAAGRVLEAETQAAIAGAQVTFQRQDGGGQGGRARTARSGSEGTFEVKGLSEGQYLLTASAKGYLQESGKTVTISGAGGRDFTLEMARGASIAGRVLTMAGEPISGATVRPNFSASMNYGWDNRLGNIYNLSASTDRDGRYRLEGLPAHAGYMVMASQRDFAAGKVSGITLRPREALEDIDLSLSRGGAVRGRVTDPEGKGIPGANIWANPGGNDGPGDDRPMINFGDQGGNATTDAEGRYALPHLAEGTYTISAQVRDRASSRRDRVAVAEEQTVEGVDFVLGDGEVVAGRVVDTEGNPVAGAYVNIYGEDQNASPITSDAEGRFQAKGFKAGKVNINAGKEGFLGENTEVTIPTGEALLTLKRSSKIIGTVRAKGRDTFPSYSILATRKVGGQGTSSFGSQQNDPTGRFEVDVGEGTYTLQASVPGFAPSDSEPITVRTGERVEGVVIDLVLGGTIHGVVVVRGTGEPIENATVFYQGDRPWYGGRQSASSDAGGEFTLEGVPAGTILLVATHPEFAQGSSPGIPVRAGETSEARIEMGAGGGIRGTVSYAGRPVAGANVFAVKKSSGPMESASKNAATDAEGRFEILGLPEGEYLISANRGGRGGGASSIRRDAVVSEGQVAQVDLSEEAGIRVSGHVTSGGEPVRARRIQVMQPERGWQGSSSEIDDSGGYTVEVPGPGTYHFMIETDGQNGAKLMVEVPDGSGEVTRDLTLPSGEIPGVAVDAASGSPVSQVQVLAFGSGTVFRSFMNLFRSMQAMARTDGQGRFLLTRLPAGSYSLCVLAEGYAAARVDGVGVADGRSAREVRVALERGIDFQVRVTDSKGTPVAQVMAFLRDADGNYVIFNRPWMSNQDGVIPFQAVLPGSYQLTTIHQSFAPARVSLRAAAGAAGQTIALRPGGKVKVQVVNRQGQPLDGAEIELLDDQGENVLEDTVFLTFQGRQGTVTGKDGSQSFDQVNPGTYRIAARKGRSRTGEERLTVAEGQASQANLTLAE